MGGRYPGEAVRMNVATTEFPQCPADEAPELQRSSGAPGSSGGGDGRVGAADPHGPRRRPRPVGSLGGGSKLWRRCRSTERRRQRERASSNSTGYLPGSRRAAASRAGTGRLLRIVQRSRESSME